jgi:hypothetical protein
MILPAIMVLALYEGFVWLKSANNNLPARIPDEYKHSLALVLVFLLLALTDVQVQVTLELLVLLSPLALWGSWAMGGSFSHLVAVGNPAWIWLCLGAVLVSGVGAKWGAGLFRRLLAWVHAKPRVSTSKLFTCAMLAAEVAYTAKHVATSEIAWQHPVGLCWGLGLTGVGQVVVVFYHFLRRSCGLFPARLHQPKRPPKHDSFAWQTVGHFAKPSAFALMGLYLSATYLLGWMPPSYYDLHAPVAFPHVLLQLVVVDVFTVINHVAEHSVSELYVASHKPHHRFVSPQLFDAFDGTIADTALLILLPLFCTMRLLPMVHTWSYIVFGMSYSMVGSPRRPH